MAYPRQGRRRECAGVDPEEQRPVDPVLLSVHAKRLHSVSPWRTSHLLGREAELFLERLQGGGGPEGVHADTLARRPHVAAPAEGGGLLHRDPGGDVGRDHAVAVRLVLSLEELPARHAHHPCPDALRAEFLVRVDAERHLATGAERSRRRYIPATRVACRSLVLPFLGPSQTAVAIQKNVFDSSQLTWVSHSGATKTLLPAHLFVVSTSR